MAATRYDLTKEVTQLEKLIAEGDEQKESAVQILEEICHCIESLSQQMSANEREGFQLKSMITEIREDEARIGADGDEFEGAKTVTEAWVTDFYDLCEGCGCKIE